MTIFRPSSRLYHALRVSVLTFGLAFAATSVFSLIFPAYAEKAWPFALTWASVVTIASILQFGAPALSLTDEQIRGHSRWLNFVITIPLANIDLAKSRAAMHGRFRWLAWDYRIYSIDGKSISVSRFAFEPKQFEQMLDAIGAQQIDVDRLERE